VSRIYSVRYYSTTTAFDKLLVVADGLIYTDDDIYTEFSTESGSYYIDIYGERETITNPEITFVNKEEGVEYTYEPVVDRNYIGIIHAKYRDFTRDILVYMNIWTDAFDYVMIKDSEYPIENYIYTDPEWYSESGPFMYFATVKVPSVTDTVSGPSISFMKEGVTDITYTPAESSGLQPDDPVGTISAKYGNWTCEIKVKVGRIVPEEIEAYSKPDKDDLIVWKDENLKAAVAEKLRVASDAAIKVKDVYGITVLDISNRGITTIEDISNFTNIRYLNASNNNITTAIETIVNINSHKNYCYVDISGNEIPKDEIKNIYARSWIYTYLKYEPQKDPRQ
jgi:hypothetical protein